METLIMLLSVFRPSQMTGMIPSRHFLISGFHGFNQHLVFQGSLEEMLGWRDIITTITTTSTARRALLLFLLFPFALPHVLYLIFRHLMLIVRPDNNNDGCSVIFKIFL